MPCPAPVERRRRRPDIGTAERAAAAQSARIGQAVADLYPQISITGSTGFVSSNPQGSRSPDLGNIFDADSFAGFVGLQVNWPVLNEGRIQGNIRVQDARFQQAVAAYQESVLRSAGEVEAGLSDFLRSRERSVSLLQAVAASKRSAEISLIQYRAGDVNFIRVNNAQTELFTQEDSLVAARAFTALGAVRTCRALGGGWEIRDRAECVDAATVERIRARTNWGDVTDPARSRGKDLGFARPAAEADSPPPTLPKAISPAPNAPAPVPPAPAGGADGQDRQGTDQIVGGRPAGRLREGVRVHARDAAVRRAGHGRGPDE